MTSNTLKYAFARTASGSVTTSRTPANSPLRGSVARSKKDHNNTNLAHFKSLWADTLRRDFVPRDARLAAHSYVRGALAQPRRINTPKLFRSLLVLAGLPGLAR